MLKGTALLKGTAFLRGTALLKGTAFLLVAVVGVGCGDDSCSDPVANECAAIDPGARGPFVAGVTTWTLSDPARLDEAGVPRTFRVEVWYPAFDDGLPSDAYDLVAEAPPELAERVPDVELSFAQNAVRDARPDASGAPYPVVLFSHGSGGIRFQNFELMTHFASHGFVVVAPDHTGNTVWDALAGEVDLASTTIAFPQRIADMPFVGDAVVNTDGPLQGMADAQRWAIMGHSFGGSIALALTVERRGMAPDPRFRVAIPMTPSTGVLPISGYDVLRSRVPILFFGAQRDATIQWEMDQLAGFERAQEPKILAAVREAGHFSFTELCRPELETLADIAGEDISGLLNDGCGEDFLAPEQMLDLQRWLATSFLHGYLRDSPPALMRLSPDALPPRVASALDYRVEGVPVVAE